MRGLEFVIKYEKQVLFVTSYKTLISLNSKITLAFVFQIHICMCFQYINVVIACLFKIFKRLKY